MSVKVGIVGAGHMGRTHGAILAQDKRVRIQGIVDVDNERASALASTLNARSYPTLEDLLSDGIDALYVATPNTRHLEPVVAALNAGVNVFSEKPMATSLAEAKVILDAVEKSGRVYQVGLNRRFAPVYKYAYELVSTGKVTPCSAHIKMNRGELKNPPWVSDTSITGGFLYESTFHLLDMCRFLLGEVETVECLAKSNVYDELDDFAMVLRFKQGAVACLTSCAHSTWAFPFERVEIFGAHSQVVTEEMERVSYSPGLGQPIVVRDYFQLPVHEKWGYVEEDRLFIGAALGENAPPVSAEDGYRTVRLVEACYESARASRPVSLA